MLAPVCSSAQSSNVSGSNGHAALHGHLPMATTDAALYPHPAHPSGGCGGSGGNAGIEAIPGVEAPLGATFEDDADFATHLLNPELFADSLLLHSSQQQHATEEASNDATLQHSQQLEVCPFFKVS